MSIWTIFCCKKIKCT